MRLLLILLAVFSAANAADFVTEEALVTEITDGDTFKVKYEDGSTDNIRLIGIDAPENKYTPKGKRDPVGGPAAKEHLEELIEGEPVILKIDPDKKSGDRLLAYVYLRVNEEPGKKFLVNLRMVEDGYAIADSEKATDHKFDEEFINAEEDAKTEERGLWGTDEVYLTTTRDVYHLTDCHHLKNLEKPEEISRLELLRENINPCKDCVEQ
jgi:endonuclease YncB( thermonuclease family)